MSLVATTLGAPDVFDGLTVTPVEAGAITSLAMRRGQDAAFARAAEGMGLPEPGRARGDVVWLGPDQYLVFGVSEAALKRTFGDSASITEQTGAWARFDMTGPRVGAAMERLTMLDVATLPDDAATRTTVHHMGVLLLRLPDGPQGGWAVMGPRSMAGSLRHALVTAARSVA